MKKQQTVLVLDFGGQYKELICRRVREMHVYSVIEPASVSIEKIKEINPIGIIFTGGPNSVYEETSPKCDDGVFSLGVPILGICYGMQYMAYKLGGEVVSCDVSEYGNTETFVSKKAVLFKGLEEKQITLMSHTDYVKKVPDGFTVTSHTNDCPTSSMEDVKRNFYAVQFHPEVQRTKKGKAMLKNFVFNVCGAKGNYSMDDYIAEQVKEIRAKVGDKKVLLGLSGGVDSSVAAALISKAVPDKLICLYVDHGFMRKNESDQVENAFKDMPLHFVRVDAKDRFLSKLKGVTEPEKKRKIIGAEFISVFNDESKKLGGYDFLAQGTIYPDVVESGANSSANIKSHHNVGGLPKDLPFIGIIEPLRNLFKDEVRVLGRKLGLPPELVNRQPFPGPGLAIRIIGEITEEKLAILREADAIFREELEKSKCKASQYFAVLTNVRSVGVMGDFRTYDYAVALRAVITGDFMTAEYAPLPHSLLSKISSRIANEVNGVSRVCYDITGKPPSTIEWE